MKLLKFINVFVVLSFLFGTINSFSQIEISKLRTQEINKTNLLLPRSCVAPSSFNVEVDSIEYDKYQLNFSWQMDEPEQGWIHWDDGVNIGGVGTCPDCWFCAAARWDQGQLAEYHGFTIMRIKAFLYDDKYDSLTFFIYEGNSNEDIIFTSRHDTVIGHAWIEDILDTIVLINGEMEYWVGYKIWLPYAANFPLGYGSGPAIAGYGDKISSNNGITWDNASDFGIDNNWNIQFYVENDSGREVQVLDKVEMKNNRSISLRGYNLYQSSDDEYYELLEFIPWTPGDTSHSITFEASPFIHCYQLTAVWTIGSDTCESAPALSKDNPDEDFVCVLLVGNEENIFGQSDLIHCFPNPFSNTTTVEYTLQQASSVQITIFNHLGEQVDYIQQKQLSGKQQVIWDAKGLPAGMYYLLLQTEKESMTGKMMIVR